MAEILCRNMKTQDEKQGETPPTGHLQSIEKLAAAAAMPPMENPGVWRWQAKRTASGPSVEPTVEALVVRGLRKSTTLRFYWSIVPPFLPTILKVTIAIVVLHVMVRYRQEKLLALVYSAHQYEDATFFVSKHVWRTKSHAAC